jgi:hypothetical protein
MKRILYLSIKIFSVLVLAAVIAAASFIYGNTAHGASTSGKIKHAPDIAPATEGVIINEVMSHNSKYYTSDGVSSNDWVELYNTTGNDISLHNFALTDSYKKLDKWPFPDVQIKAYGYLVISLTGDIVSNVSKGIIHCSFKVNSNGDSIYLIDPEQQITDYVKIPKIALNSSYGLINGEWHTIDLPTPGFENNDKGYEEYINSISE